MSVEGPFDGCSPGTKAVTVRFSTDSSASRSIANSRGETCNACDFYTYSLPVGERTLETVKRVASASMSVLGPLLTAPYGIERLRTRREKAREAAAAGKPAT